MLATTCGLLTILATTCGLLTILATTRGLLEITLYFMDVLAYYQGTYGQLIRF